MRYTTLIITFFIARSLLAQDVLIDKEGVAHFFSEAPLEDIEATNEAVYGAFDLSKGTVAVTMKMKDFHFNKSLMEEHFNENYVESEKYPKATFKGKIVDFETLDFSKTGTINAQADGVLLIHGVERPLKSDVTFNISSGNIEITTKFKVALEDHKVKIPKIVIRNIAEVVDVDASFNFTRK